MLILSYCLLWVNMQYLDEMFSLILNYYHEQFCLSVSLYLKLYIMDFINVIKLRVYLESDSVSMNHQCYVRWELSFVSFELYFFNDSQKYFEFSHSHWCHLVEGVNRWKVLGCVVLWTRIHLRLHTHLIVCVCNSIIII